MIALRQPTCRVPFVAVENHIETFGARGLNSRITLWIERAAPLPPAPLRFVVDSGSSFSMILLHRAEEHGLPVPPPEAEVPYETRTAAGVFSFPVRPGRIRLWWAAGRVGYPFDWPVLFRDTPPGVEVPSLLGLGSVFQTCRWTFEGIPSRQYPDGHLALEDLR